MNAYPHNYTNLSVLIVDDDVVFQDLTKHSLKTLGIENVDVALDGEEALEAIESKRITDRPFDVIILDWIMPGMDGISFLERFRPTNKNEIIIMVTCRLSEVDYFEAKSKGVDYYFMKPLDRDMLKIRVDSVLNRKVEEGVLHL